MTLKNDRATPARARGAEPLDVSPPDLAPQTVEMGREPPNLHIVPVNEADRLASDGRRFRHAPQSAKTGEKQAVMIDRGLQATIGGKLRDFFADIAQEPVPDRLVQLLEALDSKKESDRE